MIPIYRARKIDSEEYVEGYLLDDDRIGSINFDCYAEYAFEDAFEIDSSTLAISFDDMKDSEGTRIFASLSEDGKGGDTILNDENNIFVYLYTNGKIRLHNRLIGGDDISDVRHYFKVAGIQDA